MGNQNDRMETEENEDVNPVESLDIINDKKSNDATPKKGKPANKIQSKDHKDHVFKEHVIKFLFNGQYNDIIKNEDGQKSIELNDEEPQKIN